MTYWHSRKLHKILPGSSRKHLLPVADFRTPHLPLVRTEDEYSVTGTSRGLAVISSKENPPRPPESRRFEGDLNVSLRRFSSMTAVVKVGGRETTTTPSRTQSELEPSSIGIHRYRLRGLRALRPHSAASWPILAAGGEKRG